MRRSCSLHARGYDQAHRCICLRSPCLEHLYIHFLVSLPCSTSCGGGLAISNQSCARLSACRVVFIFDALSLSICRLDRSNRPVFYHRKRSLSRCRRCHGSSRYREPGTSFAKHRHTIFCRTCCAWSGVRLVSGAYAWIRWMSYRACHNPKVHVPAREMQRSARAQARHALLLPFGRCSFQGWH